MTMKKSGLILFSPLRSLCLAALASVVLLAGCETSVTDTTIKLPYQEELVVQGMISAGRPVENILVTRTLPPLQVWSIDAAELKDAEVTVRSGERTWKLEYVSYGRYAAEDLVPEEGKTYEMEARWNGLTVKATTYVPFTPTVDSIVLRYRTGECFGATDTALVVVTYPAPEEGVVYRALSYASVGEGRDSTLYLLQPGYRVYRTKDTDGDGQLSIEALTRCYFGEEERTEMDTIIVDVEGYEPAFYDYYTTKDNNNRGPFEGDPTAITWNVSGDGFGYFFGRAIARQTVVLQ